MAKGTAPPPAHACHGRNDDNAAIASVVTTLRRLPGVAFARFVRRFFEIEGVTQLTVIGAQAFTSLIPFLLVSAAFAPAGDVDLGDRLVARFDLHGSAALNVKALFNDSTQVESAVSSVAW